MSQSGIYPDETRYAKRWVVWLAVFVMIASAAGWAISHVGRAGDKVVGEAFINYEQFQEIYNTCQKINADLGAIRSADSTDPMFSQFSQGAMVLAKQQQLTRWVEEYNAKSKMWHRAMWKSDALPYQLSVEQFSNYGGSR